MHVIIVEDNPDDESLILRELRRGGYDVSHERVETDAAMAAALDRGRWDIVSGCELAEWIQVLCVVEDENGAPHMLAPGEPELRFAYLRRGDCKILDTWHVGGLRGTGSQDLVVENVRVPRARTMFVAEPSTLDGPLGRVPIICSMAAGYGAQALSVAQSAVDTLVELTSTKAPPEGAPLRERPAVLGEIGRHNAALEAARAYLHVCAAQLWRTAVAGGPPALDEITAMWGAGPHADAQYLFSEDVLGHTAGHRPRHAKTYRKARRGERRSRTLGAPRSKPGGAKR